MKKSYKHIGKLLFLSICIQQSMGLAFANDVVFNSSNTQGSALPVKTKPIGESDSSYNNLMKNTTINADGSITVSGNKRSQPNPSRPIGNTGLSLTKQANPSVPAFNDNTPTQPQPSGQSDGEIVVSGGQAGAQELQHLKTISGSAGGMSATIGGPSVNIPGSQTMQPEQAGNNTSSNNMPAPSSGNKDVLNYSGGVGNSANNNNDTGRVLIFRGGRQNSGNYQVENDQKDANTPTLQSFKNKEENALISDNGNSGVMPGNLQQRINQNVNDLPLPKDLPPLPGSKNGNVMLPISLPTSKAADLPPLPSEFIPNLGVQIGTTDQGGINNNGVPVNPNGDPINYSGISNEVNTPDETGVDKDWTDVMQSEANAFMDMGLPLRIVVINSENNLLRKFVSQSILRTTNENFEGVDIGLTAILSTQTTGDNINAPTCYIMFKKDDLGKFKDQVLDPLSRIAGKKATASYLIGHQVAHCMDNLERYKVLPKQNVWFADQISHYGIAPAVMRRIYPYGMTYNQYSHTTMHFYQDLGQRQYQERLADIFGLYLALYRGYGKDIVTAVQELRNGLPVNSSHNTGPAIADLYNRYNGIVKNNVQDLWKAARELQVEKGIDDSLGDGVPDSVVYDTSNDSQQVSSAIIKSTKEQKKNKGKTKKTVINPQVNFDTYSSFGSGANGMGTPFGTSKVQQ